MTSVYAQMEINHAFDPILEVLPEVTFKDDSTKLRSPLILEALLPESPASFYRYTGTLTTPPCDEAVWHVLRTTTCLGRHQVRTVTNFMYFDRLPGPDSHISHPPPSQKDYI
ncbi:hypothetical protein AVEN_209700-1 [Araneus ventricosus]|uniref:Alpha-carbonic anhydrase domain-containing protein n=1 Tax=Araneus ventricosus TaxID=182803 RepID=A0A4Y2WK79_ARAVE|nr:hypothetical protein AVEN_93908-1 [Araneus ventricosus]GBO37923.1 hypothetical protein AVEN_209700-1 [Araneus ventricosus]